MKKSSFTQIDVECANCNSKGMTIIYELKQVPVHSVLLHKSRDDAMGIQKGEIRLAYCPGCGFISNIYFNPKLQNYFTHNYDATQAFSNTFNTFHRDLAFRLIERYDLRGKNIVEIGCGQGEFLDLLCSLGGNVGVGFDPAYVEGRFMGSVESQTIFIKDYFTGESLEKYPADFICCKMTLEHIHDPYRFVNMVSRSIHNRPNTIVFFQVPNAQYVLQKIAFWDIYYEHCSYFSQSSLNYLFQLCGLQVINSSDEYDNQYITIEAKPSGFIDKPVQPQPNALSKLENDIIAFQAKNLNAINRCSEQIAHFFFAGKKIVIWGGGSKAVAFLTTLKIQDEIEYIVDINLNKHGMYLAGTGQKIVSHDFLRTYEPDVIIVMNPKYMDEVRNILSSDEVTCNLISVDSLFETCQTGL